MVQKQKSHDCFLLTQKDTMSTFAAFTRLVPAPNKITKKKKKTHIYEDSLFACYWLNLSVIIMYAEHVESK